MLSAISRRLSAARSLCRRIGLDDSGSVVTFLVAVPVLAGVVAVGVETGQLYRVKRQMQISADAAALAASIDLAGGRSSSATASAQYEAQRNGFTNGLNGATVTVHIPPTSGSFQSSTTAAEVIVQKNQGYSLGAMLFHMLNKTSPTAAMTARSVAMLTTATTDTTTSTPVTTTSTSSDACIIALTDQAEQGISITNFNNFGSDCSIVTASIATGSDSSASINMNNFNNGTIHNSDNNATIWTHGTFT